MPLRMERRRYKLSLDTGKSFVLRRSAISGNIYQMNVRMTVVEVELAGSIRASVQLDFMVKIVHNPCVQARAVHLITSVVK